MASSDDDGEASDLRFLLLEGAGAGAGARAGAETAVGVGTGAGADGFTRGAAFPMGGSGTGD